jgi:hypothetical protein
VVLVVLVVMLVQVVLQEMLVIQTAVLQET